MAGMENSEGGTVDIKPEVHQSDPATEVLMPGEGGRQGSADMDESLLIKVGTVKLEISRNCKMFNRLFHDGDDSSSLDEATIANPGPCSSKGMENAKAREVDLSLEASSRNFELHLPKTIGSQEIILEIEIQRDEAEPPSPLLPSSQQIRIKTENSSPSQSMGALENTYVTEQLPGPSPPVFPIKAENKYPALWNSEFFENISDTESEEDESMQLDEDKIKLEDVVDECEDEEDDEADGVAVKKLTAKVKRERNDFSIGERRSSRLGPKASFCNKKHEAQVMKRVKVILKKDLEDLTLDEHQILEAFPALVGIVKKRLETRLVASERLKEFEDSEDILDEKCGQLAEVLRKAHYVVIYTGAGISTSAQIPDYRGPNGIWTLLKSGQSLDSQNPVVLTTADPTVTHMTIKQLYQRGIAKHIVSQNCDGLHLRSGISKTALSEVHGNMYIEVCLKCGREYVRLFDVTEHTRRHEHRTGRNCYHCGSELRDTVVHFGERGTLRWPLNWAGAEYNVNKADVILCLGSSLKVLRRYPWLWGMDKPASKRPKLFIVNLQWTPKDQYAALKIHGKCDEVMSRIMEKLNIPIPTYNRETDPIFALATPLHSSELRSKSSRELTFPEGVPLPGKLNDVNNYIRFEPVFRTEAGDLGSSKGKKIRREILKGNGNGWLGNAWGVKPKKRKLK